jgi:GNAT superfamily N-acetyltransferase
MGVKTRAAIATDIGACVAIIQGYRQMLAKYQPRFWRPSANAAAISTAWFAHLFATADVAIVAEDAGNVVGFLIATTVPSPPVYDIPGRTAMIDDFMIVDPARWHDVGAALLDDARHKLAAEGYAQIVVVNAARDTAKATFLERANLSVASQWWTGRP